MASLVAAHGNVEEKYSEEGRENKEHEDQQPKDKQKNVHGWKET